ncbi:MAG: lipoprotein [Gammaproteobacteria bacterium]|nr:lipoprotein [Gammaproteobacteria bacterium]
MSKRLLRLVAFLLLALSTAGVVAACGQKGPLYLPEEGEEKKSKIQSSMGVAPTAL